MEGNALERSTPSHRVVNTNFRKIILEMLIFDSQALIVDGVGMGVGLSTSLKFAVDAYPPF